MNVKVNDFPKNEVWSKNQASIYLSQFYQKLVGSDGYYKFAHEEDTWSQSLQQHGVDVELFRYGKYEWDDYKIVNWPKNGNKPYDRFCFETRSCTNEGRESEGWMHTSKADYILYCFMQQFSDLPTFLDVYRISFQPLQKWFWSLDLTKYHWSTEEENNRTRSVLVPIEHVLQAIPDTNRFLVTSNLTKTVHDTSTNITKLVPHLAKVFRESNFNCIKIP